jgi:hypothetical protein
VLTPLPIESSDYQFQDGIKHSLQNFSVCFLGDNQMLLHILQGVKASMYAKRGLILEGIILMVCKDYDGVT